MGRTVRDLSPDELDAYRKAWKGRQEAKELALRGRAERAITIAMEASRILKKEFGARRVWLFGSLVRAGGIAVAQEEIQKFADVPDNHWAAPAIQFMQKAKIMKGQAEGSFAPDTPATRAEVAQTLYAYHNWRKSRDNKPEHINRGCPACHKVRQMGNRQLDLRLGVAINKLEGHPGVAETSGVDDCLSCHKPGGEAKLMLRTIVHPIHLNSAIFLENYRGSCFTCHDINADGKFEVLKKALEVNERGIPKESPFGPDGKDLREDLK